jgi:hypothetical protein
MPADVCPYCNECEWTSAAPGLSDEGSPLLVLRCDNDQHPHPPTWSFPDPDVPAPAAAKTGSSGAGQPLVHQLGLYDKLVDVVQRFDRWVEYGIVEHEFAHAYPDVYRELVHRMGHVATDGHKQWTASAYLARMLGNLTRTGDVVYRPSHGTGRWAYNSDISAWRPPQAADTSDVLSWAGYATEQGMDPDTWPALEGYVTEGND